MTDFKNLKILSYTKILKIKELRVSTILQDGAHPSWWANKCKMSENQNKRVNGFKQSGTK